MLSEQGGFHVLMKPGEVLEAADLLARAVPAVLRGFPWPKSMRWGTAPFLWVRPLHRVVCVLGGEALRFPCEHGIVSGDETEGHRVHAPGAFRVTGFEDYARQLAQHRVVLDAGERMALIRDGVERLAAAEGLEVVPDEGLLAEVAGLVEWPVPLLGSIDDAFMDLPPEVMRTTMRINQKYFALRYPDGRAAPRFALVANIEASDGGAALVAGNERVLRARLADARFFWDLDRKHKLSEFLPKLESVVFHAKLGTQGERVRRLVALAKLVAERIGADVGHALRAAELAKADLASGMVGEFPELQGIMGRYYALAGGEPAEVAEAVGAHYRPLGAGDAVPTDGVAVSVALADKLDQLAGFFAVGEKPTGSGDPFALRRAALGVIRIVRENGLRLALREALTAARDEATATEVLDFLFDRLRVQLRAEGARHDVVNAVLGTSPDDDLVRLLARAEALRTLLESEDGANLLAAYRRAANILRIEEKKDGPHDAPPDPALYAQAEERALAAALDRAAPEAAAEIAAERFGQAMAALATLRAPLDAFFEGIMVNDPDPALRRNRLALLARLRAAMDQAADLSKIDG
jgi:glycyl-tRNA synthetase beta chain